MADIGEIVAQENTIEIIHPATKEKLGVRVTLKHIDDPSMKDLKRRLHDKRSYMESRGKPVTYDMTENNLSETLANAIASWDWYPTDPKDMKGSQTTFEGGIPECTQAKKLAVFKKLPWFRDQVFEGMSDTEAFFTKAG